MISKSIRNAVAKASVGMPTLQQWLDDVVAIDPAIAKAVAGIWCGREGRASCEIEGEKSMVCVGWYNSKVEWSYIS